MRYNIEPQEPWKTLNTEYPFVTPWFRVRRDRVQTQFGKETDYTYHEHPGTALIVAVTPDLQVVLLRHYRYPVRDWCWEIPAGRLQPNETGLAVAQRELYEEAGGTSEEWQHIGAFFASTGSSNERSEVYLTQGVTVQPSHPEPTELLYVVLVSCGEAIQMAQTGQINDGPSALALLLCKSHLWGNSV